MSDEAAQPITPPVLREKPRSPVNSNVGPRPHTTNDITTQLCKCQSFI